VLFVPALWTVIAAITPSPGGRVPLIAAMSEPPVRASLVKTVAFTLGTVAVQMSAGTMIGLAIGTMRRLRLAAIALISIPLFMPAIVVGLQWRWLLDTSRPGYMFPVNASVAALSDPGRALPLLGLIASWQWTPFVGLVIATTMARLPNTAIATATLDGLPFVTIFRVVIWPHIRRAFFWALAWRLLDTIRTFDLVYVVTQGGPGSSTELLSFVVFQRAFIFWNRSEAAGAATLLLLVSLLILLLLTHVILASDHGPEAL